MPNFNSPRYQQWYIQQQTALTAFNNTGGAWTNTGAQLLRVDANSVTTNRIAPYNRFPVLTGTRSEVPGIRGRKAATWAMRGLPVIPSGTAGTIPDMDIILQNMFGQAATIVASTSATYGFLDTGYLPFSLFGFNNASTAFTQRALWGCFVTRAVFHFNQAFLTVDLDGFAGYIVDSTGFSVFDTQAKAGLSAFPTKPVSTTIAGTPIQGFGTGYNFTIHSQAMPIKVRAMDLTIETGFVPVADTYGSPYLVAVVGDARRISITLGDLLDDDSAALNDLKTQADTDLPGTGISASIVAGATAGSIVTFNLNNIQPNAFNLRDNGPTVAFELPLSSAHASAIGQTDDFTLAFT